MTAALIAALQNQLHADIASLNLPHDTATGRIARRRLMDVARHFPAFMVLLIEPWCQTPVSVTVTQTALHCSRIHLYARILDDALDEPLPVQRGNLLAAQPLFWETTQALAMAYPALTTSMTELIRETVHAVSIDDNMASPLHWGAKNHHLLLAPLLLSGENAAYQACRSGLSNLITLVQAGDEWRQGVLNQPAVRETLLRQLTDLLQSDSLSALTRHGWQGAALRTVEEARQLIYRLESL